MLCKGVDLPVLFVCHEAFQAQLCASMKGITSPYQSDRAFALFGCNFLTYQASNPSCQAATGLQWMGEELFLPQEQRRGFQPG